MPGFFTYGSDLPPGSGFGQFTPAHFAALGAIVLCCGALCLVYRRLGPLGRMRLQKALALCILGIEAVKQAIVVCIGQYTVWQLPLHLCGLSAFVLLWHAFRPGPTSAEILYSLTLPGALAALLFPDWAFYPLFNFYGLECFVFHGILLAFPLMLLANGELVPRVQNLWRPALFLALVLPPVYVFNKVFGTNFFFVNWGQPGSPLAFLQTALGNPGYLLGYAGLLLAVWALLYLPFILLELRRRRVRKQPALFLTHSVKKQGK